MKRLAKVICAFLVAATVLTAAFPAWARTTTSIFNGLTYTHNSQFDNSEIINGIDISQWQGTIDWKKAKQAGVKFAIIRIAFRGYGSSGNIAPDRCYIDNINNAYAQGIDVGLYFFTQALNTTEATAEANQTITYLKDNIVNYKKKITMPIFWDCEFGYDGSKETGRFYDAWKSGTLTRQKITNNANAFCTAIKKAGFKAGVYANPDFFAGKLYADKILDAGNEIWLAHYTQNPTNKALRYDGKHSIWQYSAKGKVDGISSDVDCNFLYVDKTASLTTVNDGKFKLSDIPSFTYTGEEIKPDFSVYFNSELLTAGYDYTIATENNTAIGTATLTVSGYGDYTSVPSVTKSFKIVPTAASGVALAERGINYITLKWSKNKQATGYKVYFKNSSGWHLKGTTTERQFTVTDLSVAANYKFKVLPYKTVDKKDYVAIDATELQSATKPDKVTELALAGKSSSYVKLSWKQQKYATGYIIYKYDYSKKKYYKLTTVTGGANNSYKVTGLTSNAKHRFKVLAYKDAAEGVTLKGAGSNGLTVYTSPAASEVTSLKANTNKTVSVKYKKISSVSGYEVMWSTTSDFSSNTKSIIIEKNTNTATITPYQSKQQYYVRVRAYTLHGSTKYWSPWSAGKGVVTK
jgi:GH25 family lysozyme M1 (1,4-beta-N-acetylmuramidase)